MHLLSGVSEEVVDQVPNQDLLDGMAFLDEPVCESGSDY